MNSTRKILAESRMTFEYIIILVTTALPTQTLPAGYKNSCTLLILHTQTKSRKRNRSDQKHPEAKTHNNYFLRTNQQNGNCASSSNYLRYAHVSNIGVGYLVQFKLPQPKQPDDKRKCGNSGSSFPDTGWSQFTENENGKN